MNDFHGTSPPEPATPAGYAALIRRYGLGTPAPPRLAAIAERHKPVSTDAWLLLSPRHRPDDTLLAQLVFALKWEGVDPGVLAALFRAAAPGEVAAAVRAEPTGAFARRIWFLYERLTDTRLDLPDAGKVAYAPAVDDALQFALAKGEPSRRHKVRDNLPGTRSFCPMVRRTPALERARNARFGERARAILANARPAVAARAAPILSLGDSKSSFAIENEHADAATRATRWARAIREAGDSSLSVAAFERLQGVVIDTRFMSPGLRRDGVFVGARDRDGSPLPEHIGARPADLKELVEGIAAYAERAVAGGHEPVAAAAAAAFGFVYAHPFADGNGRVHRWLMHHVLAAAQYGPPQSVFPLSTAIFDRLPEYRAVLESRSAAALPRVEWTPTPDGNVEVLNDTGDLYRYFDATAHAEFLYGCMAATVEEVIPRELLFLDSCDRFSTGVRRLVDMPERLVELLRRFLKQNGGRLSARARQREFSALTDAEARDLERLYADSFDGA